MKRYSYILTHTSWEGQQLVQEHRMLPFDDEEELCQLWDLGHEDPKYGAPEEDRDNYTPEEVKAELAKVSLFADTQADKIADEPLSAEEVVYRLEHDKVAFLAPYGEGEDARKSVRRSVKAGLRLLCVDVSNKSAALGNIDLGNQWKELEEEGYRHPCPSIVRAEIGRLLSVPAQIDWGNTRLVDVEQVAYSQICRGFEYFSESTRTIVAQSIGETLNKRFDPHKTNRALFIERKSVLNTIFRSVKAIIRHAADRPIHLEELQTISFFSDSLVALKLQAR